MTFHEVRFPANLSFGAVGGPERRTDVVSLANGFEERNTPWAHSRRRYDAGMGLRSLDDVAQLIAFFEARQGQLYGFRWKDWADYKSGMPSKSVSPGDQPLAIASGGVNDFQLIKTYRSGSESYQRPITKPVAGSVVVAVDGVVMREGAQFDLNTATGVVTLYEAPNAGAEVTAGYEFDVPVRFDTDVIQANVASFQAGSVPAVPVVEVRV